MTHGTEDRPDVRDRRRDASHQTSAHAGSWWAQTYWASAQALRAYCPCEACEERAAALEAFGWAIEEGISRRESVGPQDARSAP